MTFRQRNIEIELTASYLYLRLGRLEFYAGRDAGPQPGRAAGVSMGSGT